MQFRGWFAARERSFAVEVARSLAVLTLPVLSLTLAPAALAASPSCETAAERFQLPNGLEVVLVPDASLPAVAMVSSIHVGSRNDPPDHAGLAHYLEHLTYRQAPPFASVFDLYDEIG